MSPLFGRNLFIVAFGSNASVMLADTSGSISASAGARGLRTKTPSGISAIISPPTTASVTSSGSPYLAAVSLSLATQTISFSGRFSNSAIFSGETPKSFPSSSCSYLTTSAAVSPLITKPVSALYAFPSYFLPIFGVTIVGGLGRTMGLVVGIGTGILVVIVGSGSAGTLNLSPFIRFPSTLISLISASIVFALVGTGLVIKKSSIALPLLMASGLPVAIISRAFLRCISHFSLAGAKASSR
ncbi:hypothetical protein ES703_61352 [subsurface metagenome]